MEEEEAEAEFSLALGLWSLSNMMSLGSCSAPACRVALLPALWLLLWVYIFLHSIGLGPPSWAGVSGQDLSMGLSQPLGSHKVSLSYSAPAVISLLPKPLCPLHFGCPLNGTSPKQRQSLVYSLRKYLQSPYWGPGTLLPG